MITNSLSERNAARNNLLKTVESQNEFGSGMTFLTKSNLLAFRKG